MFNNISLSIVIPLYFSQKETPVLDYLLSKYSNFDLNIRKQIEFIFIDDCSPAPIKLPSNVRNINYTLYKILDNIQWNQCGARNLGVFKAHSPNILLTDVDHYFNEELLRKILQKKPRKIYQFKRKRDTGENCGKAPNVFLTTKSIFYKVLGYDEEFAGNYGFEDVFFLDMQKKVGTRITYLNRNNRIVDLISYRNEEDNNYHNLKRDSSKNELLYKKKLTLLKGGKPWEAHSRLMINFSYVKEMSNYI